MSDKIEFSKDEKEKIEKSALKFSIATGLPVNNILKDTYKLLSEHGINSDIINKAKLELKRWIFLFLQFSLSLLQLFLLLWAVIVWNVFFFIMRIERK